jgi:hypothetical protein
VYNNLQFPLSYSGLTFLKRNKERKRYGREHIKVAVENEE